MVLAVVKGLTTQPDVNSNYDKEATFYTYSGGGIPGISSGLSREESWLLGYFR